MRRRHKTPLAVRIALNVTKSTVLSVIVALSFGAIGGPGLSRPSHETAAPVQTDPHHQKIQALMARHDCSTTGFDAGVIPGSSLIRRDEIVRYVTFDEGWAVFTGELPGSLIAVCLDVHDTPDDA